MEEGGKNSLDDSLSVCGDGSHYQLYEMSPSFHKKEKVWGRDGEDMKRGGRKMTGTV